MKVIKGNINSVKGFKSYGSAVGLKKRKKDIVAFIGQVYQAVRLNGLNYLY